MVYVFHMVLGFWDFWSGLFTAVPYGDPWGAFAVLALVAAAAAKMIFGESQA